MEQGAGRGQTETNLSLSRNQEPPNRGRETRIESEKRKKICRRAADRNCGFGIRICSEQCGQLVGIQFGIRPRSSGEFIGAIGCDSDGREGDDRKFAGGDRFSGKS